MKLEKSETVDQKRRHIAQFLAENARTLSRGGSVRATWRRYQGKQLGPFFLLVFREDGKQRSLYIGADAGLADVVRSSLAELQAPRREIRKREKIIAEINHQHREVQRAFDQDLRSFGLFRKGNEVRGWRSRPGQSGHTGPVGHQVAKPAADDHG